VTPQFVDLGTGDYSIAQSINDSGQIVGYGGPGGPFIWENGVIRRFGSVGQYTPNAAMDINDGGVVVGMAAATGLPPLGFTWSAIAGMQLVTQTLGGSGNQLGAINNNGELAGSSDVPGDAASHAALWKNGTVIDLQLPNFPDGSSYSWGINDDGVVIGQYNPSSGGNTSFRWTEATGMVLIAPGQGNALRINAAGVIAGQSGPTFNSIHAYRWENGTTQDLGTLGGTQSTAIGINDAGTIVGRSSVPIRRNFTKTVAFIWKPLSGMKALSTPPGRDEAQAWAINNNDWIVGIAIGGSGVQRAVLWKLH
jgi:probable HAF family extracellular repeat protein